jgi:hypothetical protein
MFGSWLALWALSLRFETLRAAPQLGLMVLYLCVAYVFWQAARRQENYGDWVLSAAFAGWAAIPVLRLGFGSLSTAAATDFVVIASVPSLLVAVVMVMVVYDRLTGYGRGALPRNARRESG